MPEDLPPKFVTGFPGRDQDPPELSWTATYDLISSLLLYIHRWERVELLEFQEVWSCSVLNLAPN